MNTCEGCHQAIEFVVMPSGKRNPVDPEPAANGNIRVDSTDADGTKRGHVVTKAEREAPAELGSAGLYALDGVDLFVSHFATCPDSPRFRR